MYKGLNLFQIPIKTTDQVDLAHCYSRTKEHISAYYLSNTGPIRLDTLLFWCYMLMGSCFWDKNGAHFYSETCGDNKGEMPGFSLLLI